MEPYQEDLPAASVSCDRQQVILAVESRFTSEVVGDVGDPDSRDRIHDDVPVLHLVPPARFYKGTHPDANAARDPPAPDPFAQAP